MDARFDRLATDPFAQIFEVVFFPDRVYHAQYLNATRSPRYRYNVDEVRAKSDITVLKGQVYIDGLKLSNFVRIEYRGGRLSEMVRERQRTMAPDIRAYVAFMRSTGPTSADLLADVVDVRLHWCPWIRAYQVEFWETLELPRGKRHDYQVLDLMGHRGSITCLPQFAALLRDGGSAFDLVKVAFGELDVEWPNGRKIRQELAARWDNFFDRNVQVPNVQEPNADENTVRDPNYGLYFQRGWFVDDVGQIQPVRYDNGMMEPGNPEYNRTPGLNVIEMRWVLQQQFSGSLVFFHEVTIPPGTFEGVHRHIGSEELYYITEGEGTAFMGEHDDPSLSGAAVVEQHVYGFGPQPVRAVKVKPRSVIFTKSGGIHGIRNESKDKPLRFVAFLYHSA
ncbi:cupin domain-containing protein [Methylorubrum sp. SB2]|uniref:cupin domain-containing protein n=1 Tax=Methylorubrum subtropicum TaxID=3138812 RepID=UPI00313D2786